jgi:hypothetical protein
VTSIEEERRLRFRERAVLTEACTFKSSISFPTSLKLSRAPSPKERIWAFRP